MGIIEATKEMIDNNKIISRKESVYAYGYKKVRGHVSEYRVFIYEKRTDIKGNKVYIFSDSKMIEFSRELTFEDVLAEDWEVVA